MVDAERILGKLGRLDALLRILDEARSRGERAVMDDLRAFAAVAAGVVPAEDGP